MKWEESENKLDCVQQKRSENKREAKRFVGGVEEGSKEHGIRQFHQELKAQELLQVSLSVCSIT